MQQRVSLITLGVADLPRARRFYEQGLGWQAADARETVCFYQIGGLVLGLFPLAALLEDAQLAMGNPGGGGITLAHNVGSRAEVDALLQQAVDAGGTLLKPAQEVFWGGYSGYFQDPDGHPWEVAHNPFWKLAEDGSIQIPAP